MFPEKFTFQSVASPSTRKNRNPKHVKLNESSTSTFELEAPSSLSYWDRADDDSWEGFSPILNEHEAILSDRTIQQDSSSVDNTPSPQQQRDTSGLNGLLMLDQTQRMLAYCMVISVKSHSYHRFNRHRLIDENVICPHQIMLYDTEADNPYRSYLLPLAHEQLGLLYAVLGLSACHIALTDGETELLEVADEYRLKCISSLIKFIQNGISSQSHENERDGIFATIQLLLLHDVRVLLSLFKKPNLPSAVRLLLIPYQICESGISTHGAHITGAMSICDQLRLSETLTSQDERAIFFLGNLAWSVESPAARIFPKPFTRLDVIRSLSDPRRLSFSSELRQTIIAFSTPKFEQVNGCPRELFLMVGDALEHAKSHGVGKIDHVKYRELVMGVHLQINAWQVAHWSFPDNDSRWNAVGEGFRHSLLLYTSRILSPEQPAETSFIQQSVTAVLDAVSDIPHRLIELMIMPLFIAGTDALSLHSRHYVLLILDTIKSIAGFSNDLPKRLLQQVWEARGNQPKRDPRNILWTSFVSLVVFQYRCFLTLPRLLQWRMGCKMTTS